jgi:hypothetical protein
LNELKPGDTMGNGIDQTDWSPTRKVVGGAIAVLALFGVQAALPDLEIPIGVEGALTIVVAYLVPDH